MFIERVRKLAHFKAFKTETAVHEALSGNTAKAIIKATDDYFSALKRAEREIPLIAKIPGILTNEQDGFNTRYYLAETKLIEALNTHIRLTFKNNQWPPGKKAWFTRLACAAQARTLVIKSLTTNNPYINESATLIARRITRLGIKNSDKLTQTITDPDWLKELSLNIFHQNLRSLDSQLTTLVDNPPLATQKD